MEKIPYATQMKNIYHKIIAFLGRGGVLSIILIIILIATTVHRHHEFQEINEQYPGMGNIGVLLDDEYRDNNLGFGDDFGNFFQQQREELDNRYIRQQKLMKEYEQMLLSNSAGKYDAKHTIEQVYQKTISDAKHHFNYEIKRIDNHLQGTIMSSDHKYLQGVFLKLKKLKLSVSLEKDVIILSGDAKKLDNVLKILE